MRKWMGLIAALTVFVVIGFVPGCSDDDDGGGGGTTPTQTEFEILSAYMTANDLDLPAMLDGWVILASTLFEADVENYFIMDVRKADKYGPGTSGANDVPDFEDGHIPGAHSVSLADVVTYEAANNTGDLPVVVVCYTGHDAAHAVMSLRLSGVDAAQSLKWGMSSWNGDFDLWTGLTGDVAYDYDECWDDPDPAVDPPAFSAFTAMPSLDTAESDGAAILAHQLDTAVLDGLNGITNVEVLEACDDYQVFCYWTLAAWDAYGNINGAYQLTPGGLTLETLGMLDASKTIVFYCWSGQTASMVAAWLNVLGYDGRTLKFSANGMIHADLLEQQWTATTPLTHDYDTGP